MLNMHRIHLADVHKTCTQESKYTHCKVTKHKQDPCSSQTTGLISFEFSTFSKANVGGQNEDWEVKIYPLGTAKTLLSFTSTRSSKWTSYPSRDLLSRIVCRITTHFCLVQGLSDQFRQGYKSTFFFFVSQGICKECRRVRVERKGRKNDGCDCHIPNRAKPQSLNLEAASQPGRHLSVGNNI